MSTADNELRCNNLKCRVFLAPEKQAVVTTCSHIFCSTISASCATTLFSASLTCPACSQPLPEPDDIVSILAGLSPSTILEVASRAMSFWTYQMSQESAFQALVLKNAQDRLATADKRLNNDLQTSNAKVSSLEAELETARRRAQELANESREKSNELARLQAEYDKIKRKALFANPGQLEREDSVYQPSTRVARETTFGGPRSFIPAPHSGQPQPKFRAPSSARFAPPAPPVFPRSINGSSHSRSESGSGSGRMRLSHTFGSAGGY